MRALKISYVIYIFLFSIFLIKYSISCDACDDDKKQAQENEVDDTIIEAETIDNNNVGSPEPPKEKKTENKEKEKNYSQPSLDKINPLEYNLPNAYKDFYRITPKNFEKRVLKAIETWIVIFTSDSGFNFKLGWKKLAKSHRGSIFFGVVDMNKYESFGVDRLKKVFTKWTPNQEFEVAIMYRGPAKPELVANTVKAVRMASRFEPATSVRHFKPQEQEAMYKFVVPAFYHSKPYPRFPIIMIYEDKEVVPWIFKYLLNNKMFNVYFDFRCLKASDFKHLKKMFRDVTPPKKYPGLLALVGKEPKNPSKGDIDMTFDVVQFVEEKFGPSSSFKSVTEYLFWLNKEYREELPGRKFPEGSNELIRPLAKEVTQRLENVLGKGNGVLREDDGKQQKSNDQQPREEL